MTNNCGGILQLHRQHHTSLSTSRASPEELKSEKGNMRAAAVVSVVAVLFAYVAAPAGPQPVITMVRLGCDGVCPKYEVSIFSNGTVEWFGRQSAASIGDAHATIAPEQVDALFEAFRRSDFLNFQDSYTVSSIGSSTFDLPRTMLKFSDGRKTKVVDDYDGAPQRLRELELLVDRVTNTHRWRHDENATLSLGMPDARYRFIAADDLKNHFVVNADVQSVTKPGFTGLMHAAGNGDVRSMQQLLANGEQLNGNDETGWTALMIASAMGKADAVALLIENGANVGATDHNGDTALIAAAANPFLDRDAATQVTVVKALVKAGAQINATNKNGETPLMWAAKAGSPEVVELLLQCGANPGSRDHLGHDALHYVRQWLDTYAGDMRRTRFENTLKELQESFNRQAPSSEKQL